jgi:hypothetical protein
MDRRGGQLRRAGLSALACGLVLFVFVPDAAAQPGNNRIVVSLSGGVQTGAPRLTDHFEFESNVETATVDVRYPARPAVLVDGSVTMRLWRRMGVGVAVSQATRNGSAQIDARIPHPLLFEQPRTVAGSQPGVDGAETGVHVQLSYALQATRRLTVTLFGGPSFVHLAQDIVTDLKYNESYPYDVATFGSAPTARETASAVGFNAGGDVRWMFTRTVGVGGLVRFTRANIDLAGKGRTLAVRAGGAQAGVGIRLVF